MEEIKVTEYNNIRVLTTQQLAEAYEADSKTISNNFNRNRERYIEGKHFICLEGEDLREFKTSHQFDESSRINKLYLWTEKGTFLHAKSLNTDKAWEVYDRLVDNYFHTRENQIDRAQLSPQTQALMALTESIAKTELEQKRQAEQIQRLEDNQKTLADTFQKTTDTESFQNWANRCLAKIAESPNFDKGVGQKSNHAFARAESYQRLKEKWNCNLDDRVARAKGRAMERNPGITKAELNAINKLTVIVGDKSLRPIYETVIKEMMIAYCVA